MSSRDTAGSAIKLQEMVAGPSRAGAGQSRGGTRWKGAGAITSRDDNPRFVIDGTPMTQENGQGKASPDLGGVADGLDAVEV